jgi:hypothetical protein
VRVDLSVVLTRLSCLACVRADYPVVLTHCLTPNSRHMSRLDDDYRLLVSLSA